MAAKVFRFRPKHADAAIESLQLALDWPGLKQASRDDIAEAMGRFRPVEQEVWPFTMISNEQARLVLKLINASPKPLLTFRVWFALLSHVMRQQDGVCEIMAGPTRLAEDAGTNSAEASRALTFLCRADVLIRLRPGRYAINPHVGWNGSLTAREAAAEGAPQLRLVEPQPA